MRAHVCQEWKADSQGYINLSFVRGGVLLYCMFCSRQPPCKDFAVSHKCDDVLHYRKQYQQPSNGVAYTWIVFSQRL